MAFIRSREACDGQLADRHPLLLHAIAMAQGNGVLQGRIALA